MIRTLRYLLPLLLCLSFGFGVSRAQGHVDTDYGMTDIPVEAGGRLFRFRRIPAVDFDHLYQYHRGSQVRCPKPVHGMEAISSALPEYSFLMHGLYEDVIVEIRHGDELRVILWHEHGEPYTYYPDEGILMYFAGHMSDSGIDLRTGKTVDHNPGVTFYSPDRRYRIAGMFDGQESYRYRFEKLDPSTGRYRIIAAMADLRRI